MVVESPGPIEVEEREPLRGLTGQEFEHWLRHYGMERDRLVLICAIACKPKEPKTQADMAHAVKACQPLFWYQLRHVKPTTPTLICGKWGALAALGKTKGVLAGRGFIYEKYLLQPPKDSK